MYLYQWWWWWWWCVMCFQKLREWPSQTRDRTYPVGSSRSWPLLERYSHQRAVRFSITAASDSTRSLPLEEATSTSTGKRTPPNECCNFLRQDTCPTEDSSAYGWLDIKRPSINQSWFQAPNVCHNPKRRHIEPIQTRCAPRMAGFLSRRVLCVGRQGRENCGHNNVVEFVRPLPTKRSPHPQQNPQTTNKTSTDRTTPDIPSYKGTLRGSAKVR